MNLIPIKLGRGRVAHVCEDITFGQFEDAMWLREVFFKDTSEHSKNLYFMAAHLIICVEKWEGMDTDWEWPSLKSTLSTCQPSLQKRMDSLKGLPIQNVHKIFEFLNSESEVDPQLEGN